MKKGHRIASEVKQQILNRIKNEGLTIANASKEHGVSDVTIYSWIAKSVEAPLSILEAAKLRRENKALLELVGEMTLRLSEAQKKK